MNILVTNDDGYRAPGLQVLVDLLRPLGKLTVVAPKYHQSGMSMAVSLGFKPVAIKQISDTPEESWWYVDATPASCVKWALDELYPQDTPPDLVVSGINHGANTASAALYSGTLGACKEAALAGVPAVGVSLDNLSINADFTPVKEGLIDLLKKLKDNYSSRFGAYYNINFPDIPYSQVKGVKLCHQGIEHWEKEFRPYDERMFHMMGINPADLGVTSFPRVEEGEKVYMMAGDLVDDANNVEPSDHHYVTKGYITVTAHNIDTTDYCDLERLSSLNIF